MVSLSYRPEHHNLIDPLYKLLTEAVWVKALPGLIIYTHRDQLPINTHHWGSQTGRLGLCKVNWLLEMFYDAIVVSIL